MEECHPTDRITQAPLFRSHDRRLESALLIRPSRLIRSSIVLKPSTLLRLHRALTTQKYRWLFSTKVPAKPGPKGPSQEMAAAVVDMKRWNPTWGCPRIAQQRRRPRESPCRSLAGALSWAFLKHRWRCEDRNSPSTGSGEAGEPACRPLRRAVPPDARAFLTCTQYAAMVLLPARRCEWPRLTRWICASV